MTDLKKQVERAIGDELVMWLNEQAGRHFAFESQGERPDLTYRDGAELLRVEVSTAYYDERQPLSEWGIARGKPDAPTVWSGMDFDRALVEDIQKRIKDKCGKGYGEGCVLVIKVYPRLTTAEDMEALVGDLHVPEGCPFDAVYLTGNFSVESGAQGYRCWRL